MNLQNLRKTIVQTDTRENLFRLEKKKFLFLNSKFLYLMLLSKNIWKYFPWYVLFFYFVEFGQESDVIGSFSFRFFPPDKISAILSYFIYFYSDRKKYHVPKFVVQN